METQKNNKKLKITIAVLAAVLVAVVALLIVLISGNKPEPVPAQTLPMPEATVDPIADETLEEAADPMQEGAATEPTVETVPDTPDLEIVTPYCTLYYPGEWEELLHVEQVEGDVYTVKFFCKLEGEGNIELFHILFGGEEGFGTIKATDGKLVNVAAKSMEITPKDSWTTSQMNIVFTMQEALNEVLSGLALVEVEATEPTVIPEDDTPSDLDTPYGTLKYPARWDEYLVTKVNKKDDYSIKFSAKIGSHSEEHLFTVYFGGDKGMEAGTVKDSSGKEVTLRLEVAEPELDGSWTEDERIILLAMQEDMNYLLTNLPG